MPNSITELFVATFCTLLNSYCIYYSYITGKKINPTIKLNLTGIISTVGMGLSMALVPIILYAIMGLLLLQPYLPTVIAVEVAFVMGLLPPKKQTISY